MRVFLVAGSPTAEPPARLVPGPADRVIAVDYGAHHALSWGWPIHLLVGDLDSLSKPESEALKASGVRVIAAPTAKDETDLELALACASSRDPGDPGERLGTSRSSSSRSKRVSQALVGDSAGGCVAGSDPGHDRPQEIVICAALGGRTDHMLANVLLLVRPELAGMKVVIAQGQTHLRVLRGNETPQEREGHLVLTGVPGDLLSLLPIGGDAEGVTTRGLAYPLRDETLWLGQARGVSNVFDDRTAEIWLRSGLLLVVHTQIDRK